MSIGCSPKSKCAPENKNRLCFLERMNYYWTKSYIIPPRDHIKSYEILYCPCRCAEMMAKQKKEYAKIMKQCESAEKENNKKDVKKERFIMKKFKDAKPKVDCKRKDTSKTGDNNELQNCCDYTHMCSGCFETCCCAGFY